MIWATLRNQINLKPMSRGANLSTVKIEFLVILLILIVFKYEKQKDKTFYVTHLSYAKIQKQT